MVSVCHVFTFPYCRDQSVVRVGARETRVHGGATEEKVTGWSDSTVEEENTASHNSELAVMSHDLGEQNKEVVLGTEFISHQTVRSRDLKTEGNVP